MTTDYAEVFIGALLHLVLQPVLSGSLEEELVLEDEGHGGVVVFGAGSVTDGTEERGATEVGEDVFICYAAMSMEVIKIGNGCIESEILGVTSDVLLAVVRLVVGEHVVVTVKETGEVVRHGG